MNPGSRHWELEGGWHDDPLVWKQLGWHIILRAAQDSCLTNRRRRTRHIREQAWGWMQGPGLPRLIDLLGGKVDASAIRTAVARWQASGKPLPDNADISCD